MEKNKYEVLEEVVEDLEVGSGKVEPLKEYEKLLIAESDRLLSVKAKNLIKYGCFEQKEELKFESSMYRKLDSKKYKGLYTLYENKETKALAYVCPLVENNKGDVDERHDLKPYAYDIIYLEQMTEEEYKAVSKSAKHNIKDVVKTLYVASLVLYFVSVVLFLTEYITFLITYIDSGSYNFFQCLMLCLNQSATLFTACIIETMLLTLVTIFYRKYKEE